MTATEAAAPAAAGRLDFTGKLVVLLSGILSALCLTAINSVLPSIARDLAHTPTDAMLVKQLIGGVTLAMAIGAPLGGFLADRIGLRPTLFTAALLYTVAGTAGLYLNSLPLLLASRMLLGLSAATIQVLGLTMVNVRLAGNARARWMGLHVSVAIFGTLFIHPTAGQLGEISWRLPFTLYAAGAILVVGLLLGPRHSVAEEKPAPAHSVGATAGGIGAFAGFPWHYLPLSLLLGTMTYLPTVSIPFQLKQQAGATPSTIAWVLTGTAVVGAIMAFIYGPVRRRLSVHAAFLIGLGVAGTGALIASNASSFAGVLAGLLLHALGVAWFVPNIMTSVGSKVRTEQQGLAAGLTRAAHFLSAPVAVIAIQPFLDRYGDAFAMQVVAVIGYGLFVLMALRMLTMRKPPDQISAPA